MKKSILISLAIISLASCTKTIPVTVPLPLPPPLELPTIQAGELQCLANETYETLVQRYKLQKARIETLTNIIRSTHE